MKRPTRIQDIEERYLMMADPQDVKNVLSMCTEERSYHRINRRGYSTNRGKTMRALGHIPTSIYYNPFFKDIFNNPFDSTEEKQAKIRAFYRAFPRLMSVDKM